MLALLARVEWTEAGYALALLRPSSAEPLYFLATGGLRWVPAPQSWAGVHDGEPRLGKRELRPHVEFDYTRQLARE